VATAEDFYQRVLDKNTFYYFDREFETEYDLGQITTLNTHLAYLLERVRADGVRKTFFDELLQKNNGLRAILALNGFSNEQLNRVITLARVINDKDLDDLLNRDSWGIKEKAGSTDISEWGTSRIEKLVRSNSAFRGGLVNLFFEGATNSAITSYLPPFEVKKLTVKKLNFKTDEIVDTLVRYKEKGSYSGKRGNNPEKQIKLILEELKLSFDTGVHLSRLLDGATGTERTMDFIIESQIDPRVIVECSYQSTTSSGQGDKSKAEIGVDSLIHRKYRSAKFVGFVDGIGWYVRKRDLRRMVSAYDDVFTFHPEELDRFRVLLTETFMNAGRER